MQMVLFASTKLKLSQFNYRYNCKKKMKGGFGLCPLSSCLINLNSFRGMLVYPNIHLISHTQNFVQALHACLEDKINTTLLYTF